MKESLPVLVLHGPNLNMLGKREPKIYGRMTLRDLETLCKKTGKELGLAVECRQSNHEGELIELIHKSRKKYAGIVINAGGYSHSSVAIHDALKIAGMPVMEVHISNIHAREKFRHHSVISAAADGVICGFGADGYIYALQALAKRLAKGKTTKVTKAKKARRK